MSESADVGCEVYWRLDGITVLHPINGIFHLNRVQERVFLLLYEDWPGRPAGKELHERLLAHAVGHSAVGSARVFAPLWGAFCDCPIQGKLTVPGPAWGGLIVPGVEPDTFRIAPIHEKPYTPEEIAQYKAWKQQCDDEREAAKAKRAMNATGGLLTAPA